MCGICGYWSHTYTQDAQHIAGAMSDAIHMRGPDSVGIVETQTDNAAVGPVLIHRRLAILDVSHAGLQPMISHNDRYTIVYNGEIYNHLELRKTLSNEGYKISWRGHSDTETILECVSLWGIEKTLKNIIGMFAFAIWDNKSETLSLARDRLGEKPLYFGFNQNEFIFGSEMKAIQEHPEFRGEIDRSSITALIERSYIPGPSSIYKSVRKLQPGQVLTVSKLAIDSPKWDTRISTYWSLNKIVSNGLAQPFKGTIDEASTALRKVLQETVGSQMLSDVPIGAFLSGGIDSSIVTAIMQEVGTTQTQTFSIGFEDKNFDESDGARTIAEHLKTNHTELIVTPQHLMEIIPKLADIYCEPFADSSQLPTYLVSQMASRHVTVALTGDGADEMFGGYNRYMKAGGIWNKSRKIPKVFRNLVSSGLLNIPKPVIDRLYSNAEPILPAKFKMRLAGQKIHKAARLLKLNSKEDYFRNLISLHHAAEDLVIDGKMPPTSIDTEHLWPQTDCFEHWMMALDAQTYVPDDICVKVDRAAMANSLETRSPFLDARVVQFAWTLPLDVKISGNRSKAVLRNVLNNYVPRDFFERPKFGFGVPLGEWLRGPLKDWAESLLDQEQMEAQGFLVAKKVWTLWQEHLSNKGNNEYALWNILMFQAWLKRWNTE